MEPLTKFFGFTTPLCNLRFSIFRVDGIMYNSAEQYINVQKALLFGDEEAKTKIMEMTKPTGMRFVMVHGYDHDEWKKALPNILHTALMEKV